MESLNRCLNSNTTSSIDHCESQFFLCQDTLSLPAVAGSGHLVVFPSTDLAEPGLEYAAHYPRRGLDIRFLLDLFPGPQGLHGPQNALWLGSGW